MAITRLVRCATSFLEQIFHNRRGNGCFENRRKCGLELGIERGNMGENLVGEHPLHEQKQAKNPHVNCAVMRGGGQRAELQRE